MFLIIFGRAAQFVLSLAMIRVVTTFLPPTEMGRMSLIITTTTLFTFMLFSPSGMFINRRLHVWELQGCVKNYVGFYCRYVLLVCILVGIGLTIINNLNVIDLQTSTFWLWILVCGSLLFNTLNQTLIPTLNLLGFRGWFIFLTLASIVTGFIAALILILSFQHTAEYWLLGLLIGQALFAVIGGRVLFAKLSPQESPSKITSAHIKVLLEFVLPVAISVGLTWVQTQSYRFIVENSIGLAALGLFVAGYGISAGLISAFETVLTTYFQPIFYRQVSNSDRGEQSRAWNSYAGVILPSLVLVVCFIVSVAPELTRLLLAPAYHSAYQFVMWGALAEATRVVVGVYGMVAHAKMKTKLLLVPNLVGAVISLALLGWLVPKIGTIGAGVALTVAGMAVVLSMHGMMRNELEMTLPYWKLIQVMGMGVVLVGGAVAERVLVGEASSFVASSILFAVLLPIFLLFLYILLSSFLKMEGEGG